MHGAREPRSARAAGAGSSGIGASDRERSGGTEGGLAAIGRRRAELTWGVWAPVRPAGVRNGVRRVPGPDLRRRCVSGPLARFGAHPRSGVPNANRRSPLCRLRATLAAEKGDLGFLCRNGGAERSAGVRRFGPSEPPGDPDSGLPGRRPTEQGDTTHRVSPAESTRRPLDRFTARRSGGSAGPSGEHPVRDRHGGGDDRGGARQGPPEAGLGAGVAGAARNPTRGGRGARALRPRRLPEAVRSRTRRRGRWCQLECS